MQIFFSVGEPSGDLHGANLIRSLRGRDAAIECVGYGGPRMAEAGCRLHCDLTQLAVMWVWHVVVNIRRFLRLVRQADDYFRDHRPDAVVLIDYPGFNWWIARRAKSRGIPVFYYGTPQIWAWAPWRVKKMRRLVDHILCKLPFEANWFQQRACQATYVGHPYFDELSQRVLDAEFLRQRSDDSNCLITILPGSRNQEVESNLPQFLMVAEKVLVQHPHARFAIASFNGRQAVTARRMIHEANLPVDVYVGRTAELIEAAQGCLACSGSVSLELLYHLKPAVILYRVSPWAYWLQSHFRTVRYITLVNILANPGLAFAGPVTFDPDATNAEQIPYPEYLTCKDRSTDIARRVSRWVSDTAAYGESVAELRQLRTQYGNSGASERAAEYVMATLRGMAASPGRTSPGKTSPGKTSPGKAHQTRSTRFRYGPPGTAADKESHKKAG